MTSQLTAFLARRWGVPESSLDIEMQPLYGGLESAVARARITPVHVGSDVPRDLVVKRLSGASLEKGTCLGRGRIPRSRRPWVTNSRNCMTLAAWARRFLEL